MPSCPPCMAARLPLLSPVGYRVQNEGLLQREPSKASWKLHFAHFSINCRHAYRHARLPTPLSHPSSRKHRSCLLRSCCSSPMRPYFLHNDAIYGVNFLNTTTNVSLLSVDCTWFASRQYHTFIARTNPKPLRGLARALSESIFQYHTFIARTNPKTLRGIARALSESALQKEKVYVRFITQPSREPRIFSSRTPAAREAVSSPSPYDCTRSKQV